MLPWVLPYVFLLWNSLSVLSPVSPGEDSLSPLTALYLTCCRVDGLISKVDVLFYHDPTVLGSGLFISSLCLLSSNLISPSLGCARHLVSLMDFISIFLVIKILSTFLCLFILSISTGLPRFASHHRGRSSFYCWVVWALYPKKCLCFVVSTVPHRRHKSDGLWCS